MPVGVVTDRDITIRIVAEGRDTMSATASDAMTGPVQTVREDSSLKDAAELMEASKIRRVPVVDQQGKLAGIVSVADIALAGKDGQTAEGGQGSLGAAKRSKQLRLRLRGRP